MALRVNSFFMKLIAAENLKIDYSYDFKPLKSWPSCLPPIVTNVGETCYIVAGFEVSNSAMLLMVDGTPEEALTALWPVDSLKPFERLRFLKVCGQKFNEDTLQLLSYPLTFQNFCDAKSIAPKNLRALKFLNQWREDIIKLIIELSPTSSETREIIDILCDLHFSGKTWEQCSHDQKSSSLWIGHLNKLKAPRALSADEESARLLQSTSFPRGVKAQWERQGDQAGVTISMKVFSLEDWKKLKTNLDKFQIDESLWT